MMYCTRHEKQSHNVLMVLQHTSAGAADEGSAVLLVHFYAVLDLRMPAHAWDGMSKVLRSENRVPQISSLTIDTIAYTMHLVDPHILL